MKWILENCAESRHGALCYQVSWSIVMTGFMKHCDDKGMEQWDEKCYGGL